VIGRPHRILAALAAAALLAPAGSRGENLEISPVLVDLSTATPSVVVTVKNGGRLPTRYQVQGYRWSEDRAGRSTLDPAGDLAVFPPLFQLAPGAARKVRVGATVAPGPVEQAWRLMIEELPDATAAEVNQVRIRTRFAIPAFLAPVRPDPSFQVRLALESAGLALVVSNPGNVRVKPLTTRVELFGADGARLDALDVAPWYVLAGGERSWEVKVPEGRCAAVRRARVVADVAGKTVEASQEFPGGVCARR
jgi:fimbrial chaperone protein